MSDGKHKDQRRGRVVIFDDEPNMGRILVKMLGAEGFEARAFNNPAEGIDALPQIQPDVLLTDVRMPQMDGKQVLAYMRAEYPDVPVLIFTGFGSVEDAVEAVQAGAFNYITKPFEQGHLLSQVERALELRRMQQENARLTEQLAELGEEREIIGDSEPTRKIRELIARAAPTDSSVLITGKSGVGKELVARAIHAQSKRAKKRFVAINCPSIPPTLIESEMFGHEKGAFTGADRSKMGLIELAEGGTLFLDEVAELPIEIQVKLLRVIQEREIQRVGGLKQIPVNLRLITATNRNLALEMEAGRFREDLFYRLNVIHVELAPLSERREDIAPIAEAYIRRIERRLKRPGLMLTAAAMTALQAYHWPGNVRELENVLERATVLTNSSEIDVKDLTIDVAGSGEKTISKVDGQGTVEGGTPLWPTEYQPAREIFERQYLSQLLDKAQGNISRAALMSGISRRNLYDKLDKAGLSEELKRRW